MQRIIIKEEDNTSNVENLSSYDVAYVPGFAVLNDGTVNASLYRKPQLVTDKYQFVNLYGSTAPRFATLQPYPDEFDEEAKKDSDAIGAYIQVDTTYFDSISNIVDSEYYTQISDQIGEIPDNTNYYVGQTNEDEIQLALITGETSAIIQNVNQYITGCVETTDEAPVGGTTYYKIDSSGNFAPWTPTIQDANERYIFSTDDDKEVYTQATTSTSITATPGVLYLKITPEEKSSFEEGETYFEKSTVEGLETYTETSDETVQTGKTYYTITIDGRYPNFSNSDTYYVVNSSEIKSVFSSITNPSEEGWYELDTENSYSLTTDTYIDVTNVYYKNTEGIPPMFEAGDADPGYRYALLLLSMGMPVYFEQMNQSQDDITVANMYTGLTARFVGTLSAPSATNPDYSFDSMGDYNVKFITSGGYPTFEYSNNSLANNMIQLASNRQDAIALIDHTDNPNRDIDIFSDTSVITKLRSEGLTETTYGAMFSPWYECTNSIVTLGSTSENDSTISQINNTTMPGSLAYLTSLAQQLLTTNPWLAVAGVTRGRVPFCGGLHTNKPLTNNIADTYQALPSEITLGGTNTTSLRNISINPITYIRNYGYCIWGNRTLKNNAGGTTATSFLNIRSVTSDIKKRLYETSQQLLFDQNTDVLWLNFKSHVTPLLEEMVSDYILNDYTLTRFTIDPKTGQAVPAYKVLAVIRIQPINSVEVFELTVSLENVEGFVLVNADEE